MKLILFFNGWGMDRQVVENLELPEGYELKVLDYPYVSEDIELKKYSEINLIGWSFGCYYLTQFLKKNNLATKNIIGINGHSQIIGKNGIAPKMLEFTLDNLTPETLLKFYENMEITNFKTPKRDFESIRSELRYFKESYEPLANVFNKIFIGKRDKIVPSSKQKRYCINENIECIELDCGHYPFEILNSWSEIL